MKRYSIILLLFFILMPMAASFAQNPVSVIDSLDIDIWPDYDRASVLVLLTGSLPKDTPFPASVTLPLPEGAQLNAVARIDGTDGEMKDDIISTVDPAGTVTFITPDLRFRVEYYLPYTVDKDQRSFTYTWLAAIAVNHFQLKVQRPTWADTFNTEPASTSIVRSADGFEYYIFAAQAVPAGKPFRLHVDYQMTTAQLSVNSLPSQNKSNQTSPTPAQKAKRSGANWALAAVVAGGIIIIAGLIWQIAIRRSAPNIGKKTDSTAEKQEKQSRAKFCRECGEPVDKGDNFCRGCGAEL
jgi:hypothetical protein